MQTLRVTEPAELLAAIPYILGFHPTESLVLVGICDNRVRFALRVDLAECQSQPEACAQHLADMLSRQVIENAVVVGYGAPEHVDAPSDKIRQAVSQLDIPILDVIRVTEGRFYSAICIDPGCCPPEGKVFTPDTSVIAAEATLAGHVALPDRATLVRSLAHIEDREGTMPRAISKAEQRIIELSGNNDDLRKLTIECTRTFRKALKQKRKGQRLTNDQVAWLSISTLLPNIRDLAFQAIEEQADDHIVALWTEVACRALPGAVAPAASLLGFAAYLSGQGALASIAIERALEDNTTYPMAVLLQEVLMHGLSPDLLNDPDLLNNPELIIQSTPLQRPQPQHRRSRKNARRQPHLDQSAPTARRSSRVSSRRQSYRR